MANNSGGEGFHLPLSTFAGDRGGSAEDADLLAELRAISTKSSSNRFANKDDDTTATTTNDNDRTGERYDETNDNEKSDTHQSNDSGGKKGSGDGSAALAASTEADSAAYHKNDVTMGGSSANGTNRVADAAAHESIEDTTSMGGGGFKQSNLPQTYAGNRGGSAEDADLLAELRAISNKSSSSNRFEGEEEPSIDGNEESKSGAVVSEKKEETKSERVVLPPLGKKSRPLPPWKRKGAKKQVSNDDGMDVVISAPPAPAAAAMNNFQNAGNTVHESSVPPAAKGNAGEETDEEPAEEIAAAGIKSSLPKTFMGNRGGEAEDADLLAELRAISNKSSSSNRFDDENNESISNPSTNDGAVGASAGDKNFDIITSKPSKPVEQKDKQARPLPPWKRKGAKKKAAKDDDMDFVIASPPTPTPTNPFRDVTEENGNAEEIKASHNVTGGATSESAAVEELNEQNFGIKSSLPKTFMGDRGGVAADADLLAELRAISNKASGNRFDGEDDGTSNAPANDREVLANEKKFDEVAPKLKATEVKKQTQSRPLPPWKRKGAKKKMATIDDDLDFVIAAPADETVHKDNRVNDTGGSSVEEATRGTLLDEPKEENMGIKSSLPQTFMGDRGGDAADAELLAELRAISKKSSSSNRFDDDNDEPPSRFDVIGDGNGATPGNDGNLSSANKSKNPEEVSSKAENSSLPLPPWKRKGAKKKITTSNDSDIVIAAPPSPSEPVGSSDAKKIIGFGDEDLTTNARDIAVANEPPGGNMGIKSSLPNTFKGDRGGDAADAELLAELRAISMKTSSNRFDGEEDEADAVNLNDTHGVTNKSDNTSMTEKPWKKSSAASNEKSSKPLPPWKRKGAKKKAVKSDDMDVVIAAPPAASESEAEKAADEPLGSQTRMEATGFGTAAEPQEENMGIKSNLPNTVKGDRGGEAADAELLAELRAISMKTSSNRFDEEENEAITANLTDCNENANKSNSPPTEKPWKKPNKAKIKGDKSSGRLPPWKQKNAAKLATKNTEMDVVIAESPARSAADPLINSESSAFTQPVGNGLAVPPQDENMGIKSNLPNTVKGDRGGSAEDDALLAELRAISMKSSNNRFKEEANEGGALPTQEDSLGTVNTSNGKKLHGGVSSGKAESNPVASNFQDNQNTSSKPGFSKALPQGALSSVPGGDSMGFGGMAPAPPPNPGDEINITLEGLDTSLKSPKWQLRKASYLFLHSRLSKINSSGDHPMNRLKGEVVYEKMDQTIPNALKDKNAGALDAALTLSLLYADSCQGACSDGATNQIMTSLLKGTAFSSSRSGTLSSTEELVLKLIEVAPEGSSSIPDIFDLIQEHGLKSRKPKVVLFSAKLILKCVHEFGTGVLPIPKLSSNSETLIAHSNAQAREAGIKLLAEMCRALGSKAPLQRIMDKLKTSQQSQLDSLLDAQPASNAPSRRLRCRMGEPVSTQSPEEALAALKKSQEENEAKALASRPRVNLFQVLPQTCYKEKMKLDKWSEKVAALDALITSGGEQPYKLCLPSGSVNYTPLIRELRQLLSHTHFAVCSKALAAFGMLSEGVGEQLCSNFRPLLPTLVALFKDKKVCKAVAGCLDKMFSNVFSFENLLDSDSILVSLDEKKQKNALVRKNALEFLARCVKTSGTYGTRGELTGQYAEDLSKLACEKLKDSDASTRKAATDVLLALLSYKDASVVTATKNITSSLETSNPRAYKSLKLASTGGDKKVARPQSAPANTSSKASKKEPSSKARTKNLSKSSIKSANLPKPPCPMATEESADEKALPSLEDAIENLSALSIAKWGDGIDDEGILAGIQSSNWKARKGALTQLKSFYETDGERSFDITPSLFVLVRDCTKSFKESNFNVARAVLELFTAIFGIHSQLIKAPQSYLYIPATKLAVEKVGDRKLSGTSSSCLHSICLVKDPQRVLAVAIKTINDVKSPLVHEALLGWFKLFCIDFGASSLSTGVQESLTWVLKECESNNMKVRKAALDVMGALNSQLGPIIGAFVKSKDIQSSSLEKALSDNPHDTSALSMERKMKCLTLSASSNSSHQGSSQPNMSSILSIPTTDLVASLKSDCISRINTAEGKNAWKLRKEGMEEVKTSLSRCGGLISTEGKAFLSLKQLFLALRARLNDSQSNLKPISAALIGSLLNHVDGDSQAKLGKIVFPALVNAAMNDMKKMMKDAALSSLLLGTERPQQNGGGVNPPATECFILCLESELSDAALKSSGLSDVLAFLATRLESYISIEQTENSRTMSVNRQLARVVVQSLLSSKAGTRSAAEKLLSICVKSGLVSSEALDKEIGKLLPAQERTVRSFIPNISTQERTVVETPKQSSRSRQSIRPNSSSRQPSRCEPTRTKKVAATVLTRETSTSEAYTEPNMSQNPLHPNTSKSTKLQRLSLLGRNDNWPDYPEDPSSNATLQALRKSWSLLISSSTIHVLFPKGGFRSHEDSIKGCEIISQSIEYSRNSNDISFLEQLDFIFKWIACALSSRDHTSGLRSLLTMLQLLLGRLHELSYVINDAEAIILLFSLIEKAGVAKSQFKDQFDDILSFVRSKQLYQFQRYGSSICMKIVEKSKSISARSLAAGECSSCVSAIGVGAIGKKGVIILARALTAEKLVEIRTSYLDLFYIVVQKYGDLDKLLSIIGDSNLTDKTKQMIVDRCSKRPSTAPAGIQAMHHDEPKQTRLRTPSNKHESRTSSASPRVGNGAPQQLFSSSAAATGKLKSRLQRFREENQATEGSIPPSPSLSSSTTHGIHQALPPTQNNSDLYMNSLNDIRGMIAEADTTLATNVWIVKGSKAIRMLSWALKKDASNSSLNATQLEMLRQQIASNLDECVETLTSSLKLCFEHGGENAATLPYPLIKETVDALTYFFRNLDYVSSLSQDTLEYALRETVHALLDDRLGAANGAKADTIGGTVVRAINKLAMREATAPSRETSLSALILLQQSTISSIGVSQPAKVSRVFTKLFNKVMKDEHEKNKTNPLGDVKLDSLLYSLDWLLQTMEEIRSSNAGDGEILVSSLEMSKRLMTELVKCRGASVRECLEQLELPECGPMEKLLVDCEQEMGLPTHLPQNGPRVGQHNSHVENKGTHLAGLVNHFAEAEEGPDRQVALVALCNFKRSNIDFEAHLSHLSPHFRQHILDAVGKASKENSTEAGPEHAAGDSLNERMKNLQLGVGQNKADQHPPVNQAASLRARLEALRHSTS